MAAKEIEMVPVTSEPVTPAQYIRLLESDPSVIASVKLRPAQLGEDGFGSIVVEYRTPIYRYKLNGRIGR